MQSSSNQRHQVKLNYSNITFTWKTCCGCKVTISKSQVFSQHSLAATVTFEGSKPTALWVISNNGQSTHSTTQCTVQGLTATRLGHMLGPSTWAAPPSPPAAHQLCRKLDDILHQFGLFMGTIIAIGKCKRCIWRRF